MHPRNRFRDGYDFPALTASSPALAEFVAVNRYGNESIDFANPDAVLALNQALLKDAYGLQWSLPKGALCPPIPGRSDYLHYLADLLSGDDDTAIPTGPIVKILDIGTGANCIYPMVGASEYGWQFVGTETDKAAMHWARQIVRINTSSAPSGARPIAKLIECRWQPNANGIFANVTTPGETFAASMCNPPFHASAEEAADGSTRKRRNLGLSKESAPLNFGGQGGELWCVGGELGFIQRMIVESAANPNLCFWFTTLVSKSEHLRTLKRSLREADVTEMRVVEMAQGQKKSRILAWTFAR